MYSQCSRKISGGLYVCRANPGSTTVPWGKVINTIKDRLESWERSGPTIFGRRLIVSMEVGGRIQYLAKVQGMPPNVLKRVKSITMDFMWKGARVPPINADTLYLPISQGGVNLMDLEARVKAITLTWLRPFLDMSQSRPFWAFVADALIGRCALKSGLKVADSLKMNIFLQEWNANTTPGSAMPQPLREMLTLAKKFNVSFNAIRLAPDLKRKMPLWLHIGIPKDLLRLQNRAAANCLKSNHGVKTVGDVHSIVVYGDNRIDSSKKHFPKRHCCDACAELRPRSSCVHPLLCYKTAKSLFSALSMKWDPSTVTPYDGLSLTPRRTELNITNLLDNKPATFDPSVTVRDDLSKCFRIFTGPGASCSDTADRPRTFVAAHDELVVFTDGSCDKNGADDAKAGAGVWVSEGDGMNKAVRVPGAVQTNQTGELTAILYALQQAPLVKPLLIKSDSKYCVEGITVHSKGWESTGWIGVANRDFFKAILSWARRRAAPTRFQWVKGHSGIEGNEEADRLASLGASLESDQALPLDPVSRFLPSGAQISSMSQKLLYKGIKESAEYMPRNRTIANLSEIQDAVVASGEPRPTHLTIWRSLRHCDHDKKTKVFLWKATHDGLKCGSYWLHGTNLQERATCQLCDQLDSVSHILFYCKAPERAMIWSLCEESMRRKGAEMPDLTLGTVLGCTLVPVKGLADGKVRPGASRTFRILAAESAYLIWKMRCERVIDRENDPSRRFTAQEVTSKWSYIANKRLKLDQAMTHERFGKKRKIPIDLVLSTWSGLLIDEAKLPPDWVGKAGVLVGVSLPERD